MRLAILTLLIVGASEEPRTPRDQYEALVRAYDAEKAEITRQEDAETGDLGEQPIEHFRRKERFRREAAEKFLTLARQHPDDPIAIDALLWVIGHNPARPEGGEAMRLLAQDHFDSPQLGPIIQRIDRMYGSPFDPLEEMLRSVLERSPHREVRGSACLALARYLKTAKEITELLPSQYRLSAKGDGYLARLAEEAEAHFDQAARDYGDLQWGERTLTEIAEAELFELRNLAVGQVAPEIVGEDIDGRVFKLSDYRGQVVVLDFYSYQGCGICRVMLPDKRSLIERLDGKPFVIIGVNSGDDRESLQELRDQGVITWRSFWDQGEVFGPIHQLWNVNGWPTTYIIDHEGVIRRKGTLQSNEIRNTVHLLLDGMESEFSQP